MLILQPVDSRLLPLQLLLQLSQRPLLLRVLFLGRLDPLGGGGGGIDEDIFPLVGGDVGDVDHWLRLVLDCLDESLCHLRWVSICADGLFGAGGGFYGDVAADVDLYALVACGNIDLLALHLADVGQVGVLDG